jgi:ribosomal protein S18 acetylase RimI-like enzyme
MDGVDSGVVAAAPIAVSGEHQQHRQHRQQQQQQQRRPETEILIRHGTPSDADSLAEIAVAAWQPIRRRQAQALGLEQFARKFPDWESAKAAKVRETCGAGFEGSILVATLADADCGSPIIVGFVSFGSHDWREPVPSSRRLIGEIWNNAVHPRYQRRGIGSKLYEAALEEMAGAGMQSALVGVSADNVPACSAYEKVGFHRVAPDEIFCRCDLLGHKSINLEPEPRGGIRSRA